ncbi:MAG: hypothetical protein CL897_06845 [Dehalococcoidia bacterium]|nr:hypothetical protein [Dehalococcoidia bacterium]HCV00847.1 hypothetical protein [Dehalococcoidia bacterium]
MAHLAPKFLTCPDCVEPLEATDNYCRNCGMFLRDRRMPVARPSGALEVRPPALPVPVRRAITAIAVGTALKITANIASTFLAKRATSKGSTRALTGRGRESTVVSESLFVRRTWTQRD